MMHQDPPHHHLCNHKPLPIKLCETNQMSDYWDFDLNQVASSERKLLDKADVQGEREYCSWPPPKFSAQ